MTKSLPISLRWKVIMWRQRGLTLNQIAEPLFVSKTFVKKVIRLYENTGAVSDPPRRKSKKRKILGSRKCWPLKLVALCGDWLFISFLCMWIILTAENLVIRRAIEDKPELYLDELQLSLVRVSDRWSVCNANPQQNCAANGIDSKEGTERKRSAVKFL